MKSSLVFYFAVKGLGLFLVGTGKKKKLKKEVSVAMGTVCEKGDRSYLSDERIQGTEDWGL